MSQVILQPSEMLPLVLPHEVEYRRQLSLGIRVVRVLCYGQEPRIMSWTETFLPNGMLHKEPMSLGLVEIELFISDAGNKLGL